MDKLFFKGLHARYAAIRQPEAEMESPPKKSPPPPPSWAGDQFYAVFQGLGLRAYLPFEIWKLIVLF